VEAATRETSASALMLITAPSQQEAAATWQEEEFGEEEDAPCTAEASGQLSRCRLRVRMLRCEGVSQSKERDLLGGSKGDVIPAGLLCG
jgi:hypothetical protein